MQHSEKNLTNFVVKDRVEEATDIVTLRLVPTEGTISPFIPGQFVNIYFLDDRCGGQGKPYSIASIPSDGFLDITVKKIGRFSEALHSLAIGETVSLSTPQGFFYPDQQSTTDIVFLAGGIGITPFYSIIRDILAKDAGKNLILFYSNKAKADTAFMREIDELKNSHANLKVIYAFTRQGKTESEQYESDRINVDMIKKHLGTLDGRQYFICGSIGFVRDLWKELKQNGVPEENLQVESFY